MGYGANSSVTGSSSASGGLVNKASCAAMPSPHELMSPMPVTQTWRSSLMPDPSCRKEAKARAFIADMLSECVVRERHSAECELRVADPLAVAKDLSTRHCVSRTVMDA